MTASARRPTTDGGSVSRHCPYFQAAVELIGRRWSGAILLAAARGATRYSEFLAAIPGLSDRLLAQRLHELEEADILVREVIASTPVQTRYTLTARGADLAEAVQPLLTWGELWLAEHPIAGESRRRSQE